MKHPWLTVLIFLIVGPPVGLTVLWGLMMPHDRELIAPVRVQYFLSGAYMFGGVQALAAGIWVAALEKPTFWRVSRAGLVVGAIFALFLALGQLRWLPGLDANAAIWEPQCYLSGQCLYA
jgi:hypothetical protein